MGPPDALLAGASIGLTVAAPIGPMAAIVVHRTLAGGFSAGMATGAGASTIHLLYATLAIGGLDRLATYMADYRAGLQALAACILFALAIRMIVRLSAASRNSEQTGGSLLRHYVSALAFNSINPMSLVLLFGAIAAFTGLAAQGGKATWALAAGVFLGSIGWWLALVAVTATVGVRLSPGRTRLLDLAAALFMIVLAVSAMARLV